MAHVRLFSTRWREIDGVRLCPRTSVLSWRKKLMVSTQETDGASSPGRWWFLLYASCLLELKSNGALKWRFRLFWFQGLAFLCCTFSSFVGTLPILSPPSQYPLYLPFLKVVFQTSVSNCGPLFPGHTNLNPKGA